MPIYDFHCDKCNKTIEKILTISTYKDEFDCECGSKTKRQYSGSVSFDFRGEGTYKKGFDGAK